MSNERSEWINKAMEIHKKKGQDGIYIKVTKEVHLKEGDYINVKDFQQHLKELVDKGIITVEKAEESYEKAHFVTHVCDVPPNVK